MAMVYQKGTVYLQGARERKWYGKFRVYLKGRNGEEVERTRKVVLGKKSELRKWEAEEKLKTIVQEENGKGVRGFVARADDSVTFGWFVSEKYVPMRRGRWRRSELVGLELDEIQMRQGHWAVVDLIGKGGHIRTVPIPEWVKAALDQWTVAAGVTEGRIFRAVARKGKVWGKGISQNVVWYVVKTCCEGVVWST